MYNRDIYLQKLISFKDKPLIKVISGIRRCGKSTLLKLYINYLKNLDIKEEQIIYINFESLEYEDITYKELYNLVKAKNGNDKLYILLDEVQRVDKWEKAINSFLVDFNVDIYITGSNAYLLSSELSTYLSGRYIEIKMLPFSFKEFIEYNNFPNNTTISDKFDLYLKYGGMPCIFDFNFNQEQINMVLDSVYSTVVMKDILQQSNLRDINSLKKIVLFLADNIGNICSSNKISNILSSENKEKLTSKTVDNYINLLQNAFIFYNVGRYDIKGKEYLKSLEKYYIVDIGIRNYLLGYRNIDRGHIIENVVFLELLRRGYKVSIGKIGDKEVDFIATNQNEKIYFQISETIANTETKNRELASLKLINDNYEKYLITSDKSFILDENGIKFKNIIDWLLE